MIKQDTQKIIELKNLKKYFETNRKIGKTRTYVKAVNDINLDVLEGEILGIVGESGCGKSTVGNLIMGLIEPTEGEVIINNTRWHGLTKKELKGKRRDIQMIFQDPFSSLNPRMKVFDIIAEPLITHNLLKGKALKEEIYKLLEQVGLSRNIANRYPHEFSGGQRQRIGIARAIALKPKVIICDEPVSALDVSIQAQILNLLKDLQEKLGLTFVFIGHGMPAIKFISDRIAVMYLGKVVELAEKENIFNETMHPYTRTLLNSIPILSPDERDNNYVDIIGEIPSPENPPSGCPFHPRCPLAQEKCKEIEPAFEEKIEGHFVACHFPLISN